MKPAFSLWWLLRRRTTDSADPARLTEVLAAIAFAVTTAVMLVVIGGWQAFTVRANTALDADAEIYPILAAIAAGLLVIPLITLGGAAARIAVNRRDARLATLRLAGATNQQISVLTLLESGLVAIAGVITGIAAYFGLIFAILPITFQNDPFSYSELVLPVWAIATIGIGIILVALASAGASLRKVMVTPIGVAANHEPASLHWSRILPILLVAGIFAGAYQAGQAGMVVLIILLLGGLAMINLIGPFVMGMIGKIVLKRAKDLPHLLAARRLLDQPKTAWRSVGGVALATFIAGITAAAAMLASFDNSEDPLFADIGTGGLLTLAIAAIVAAVSTGVLQSGRVIDQRTQYQNLNLAGADPKLLDRARVLETSMPLIGAVSIATMSAALFLVPVFGATFMTSAPLLLRFILSVGGACALVLLGAKASGGVAKKIVAQPA